MLELTHKDLVIYVAPHITTILQEISIELSIESPQVTVNKILPVSNEVIEK